MSSKYSYQLEHFCETEKKDFGEQIRKHIKNFTGPESLTEEATEKTSKQIDSLERLANNTYGRKYQRVYSSTATGLTAEQCGQVLSSEFLQNMKEEKIK